jgi:hypothetical protein
MSRKGSASHHVSHESTCGVRRNSLNLRAEFFSSQPLQGTSLCLVQQVYVVPTATSLVALGSCWPDLVQDPVSQRRPVLYQVCCTQDRWSHMDGSHIHQPTYHGRFTATKCQTVLHKCFLPMLSDGPPSILLGRGICYCSGKCSR